MVGREVHFTRDGMQRRDRRRRARGRERRRAAASSARPRSRCGRARSSASPASSARAAANSARRSSARAAGAAARSGSAAGRSIRQGPWDGKAAGIGMVPEDRKTSGLFLGMDLVNNIAATVLSKVSSGVQFLQRQGRGAGADLRRRTAHRDAERAPDRRQSLGRQPAEGAARQMAGDGAEAADRRRADARRRCRRALRDLPPAAGAGRHAASRSSSSRPTCPKCWRSPTASS